MECNLNLHAIVSPVLNAVQQTETVYVFKCLGITNNYGDIVPDYASPIKTQARWQIDSDEALEHADNVNQNMVLRKVYIDTSADNRLSGINRTSAKQADYIYRERDNTWWMINATYDEFSAQGWVCVRAVLQLEGGMLPPFQRPPNADM